MSAGLTFSGVSTTREDGINMNFTNDELTLGNIIHGDTRSARWTFRANSVGKKSITFRVWSENAGTVTRTNSVTVN